MKRPRIWIPCLLGLGFGCVPTIASLQEPGSRRKEPQGDDTQGGDDTASDADTEVDSASNTGSDTDTGSDTGPQDDTAPPDTDTGSGAACPAWGDIANGLDGAVWNDLEVGDEVLGMYQITGSGNICSIACDRAWIDVYDSGGALEDEGLAVYAAPSYQMVALPNTVVDGKIGTEYVHVYLRAYVPYDGSERGQTTTCEIVTSNGTWTATINVADH